MKIGFWELVVIVVIAFVFIGPDQLPVYAKKLGKMLRELKKYTLSLIHISEPTRH